MIKKTVLGLFEKSIFTSHFWRCLVTAIGLLLTALLRPSWLPWVLVFGAVFLCLLAWLYQSSYIYDFISNTYQLMVFAMRVVVAPFFSLRAVACQVCLWSVACANQMLLNGWAVFFGRTLTQNTSEQPNEDGNDFGEVLKLKSGEQSENEAGSYFRDVPVLASGEQSENEDWNDLGRVPKSTSNGMLGYLNLTLNALSETISDQCSDSILMEIESLLQEVSLGVYCVNGKYEINDHNLTAACGKVQALSKRLLGDNKVRIQHIPNSGDLFVSSACQNILLKVENFRVIVSARRSFFDELSTSINYMKKKLEKGPEAVYRNEEPEFLSGIITQVQSCDFWDDVEEDYCTIEDYVSNLNRTGRAAVDASDNFNASSFFHPNRTKGSANSLGGSYSSCLQVVQEFGKDYSFLIELNKCI